MYLDVRQKELIRKAIKDYTFICCEIENQIANGLTFEELADFILKFRDTEITNKEDYSNVGEGYLDFLYKDINTYVGYNKEKGVYVSNVFEIYDKEKCEYIVEDWLRIKDYEELLNTPKENVLNDLVADLKHIECNTYKEDRYKEQVDKIISFLKEEW